VIDVAIDARRTRRMSLGMRACVDAVVRYAPQGAPELRFAMAGSGEHFTPAEQIGLPLEIARSGARFAYYSTPLAPIVRAVPYAIQVHDLTHVRFPEWYSPAVRVFYATAGAAIIRGARRIVVADAGIGRDLDRYFGIPKERLRVCPLGYDPAMLEFEGCERRERPYVLYAGNRRPHKNLATLVEAWRRLAEPAAVDLVVAGPEVGLPLADEERAGRRLSVLGEIDRDRLWSLYRGAVAYVHPAIAEGFGLPMLEALVLGTPVIGSTGSVPEVIRPYVRTFEATDAAALAALIEAAVRDPFSLKTQASEGAAAARAYTWVRFGYAVAEVFREVLQPGP
jgi:glycosyltransferase involved in cell wall biosynthesis